MSEIRIKKTGEPDVIEASDGRLTLSVNPSCACCGRGMDILLAFKEEVLKNLLGRIPV